MAEVSQHEVSQWLIAWSDGDQTALDKLVPLVHQELHRLAHNYLNRERQNRPLQTTELINEAYVRLIDWRKVRWQNRAHFFAVSAQMMRRILVDFARKRRPHESATHAVSFNEATAVGDQPRTDLVALDGALTALAALDKRKSQVVELRFFGGFSVDETAEFLEVSPVTVMREWNKAKAWLYRELAQK
jgi:RNA polymerase sigma factor (TIGR02999 family)